MTGTSRHTHRQVAVPVILTLVVFFLTGLLLNYLDRLRPFPFIPVLSEKLEHFRAHGEQYDTVFIGTSRLFRHVIPEAFDAEMARLGCASHSFNYGVAGMDPPEFAAIIREVGQHGPNVRRIVWESGLARQLDREHWWTDKTRWSNRLATLPVSWRNIAAHTQGLERLSYLAYTQSVLFHELGMGMLARRVFPEVSAWNPGRLLGNMENGGWLALEVEPGLDHPRHRDFMTQKEQAEFIRRRDAFDGKSDQEMRYYAPYLDHLTAEISALPGEHILIHGPTLKGDSALRNWLTKADMNLLYLRYTPDTTPNLFDPADWFDDGHLLQDSARRFSRQLAQDICRNRDER